MTDGSEPLWTDRSLGSDPFLLPVRQVRAWLEQEGELLLQCLNEPVDSLDLLSRKQQDFKEFYAVAYVSSAEPSGEPFGSELRDWPGGSNSASSVLRSDASGAKLC